MAGDNESAVRFGIMGCAGIARKVSRAIRLSPTARLTAVASRSAEKARRFAAENEFPEDARAYGSYEELLDDPAVDAVYVPLPTSLHRRWVTAAARKGKHVLVEKPAALDAAELEEMLGECESNGVQFMDGTMWMHHPRTARMKSLLNDAAQFGDLRWIHTSSTFHGNQYFLENDIRVKPDLDGLGALGDTGWYCIRAILWAFNYQLPKTVTALPGTVFNKDGVILACGSSMDWNDGRLATFYCSFLSHTSMDLSLHGTNGCLQVKDFIIPFQESSASFLLSANVGLNELHTGWTSKPKEFEVVNELPQEALLIEEFSTLVRAIRSSGSPPDPMWPNICLKNQLVLDAVKKSIEQGCKSVELGKMKSSM
ncbi:putative oxidoreductase [Nymphaea thermarum]|nr:putative oxidoreductase [Nymphaea thermarum]